MASAASRIQLESPEESLISALDAFAKYLREKEQRQVELRIAGGWVRDKLLGLPSDDLDVAISTMTGYDFATQFAAWVDTHHRLPAESNGKPTTVACIAANPDQSKHLETATATLFHRDIDFVQLRSEEYSQGSRIPTGVKFGSPKEDAERRDITINALFFNCHSRDVEDFTGSGLSNLLEHPLIRCPLPPYQTFFDDPLRILRCIRFASRFGFPLDASIVDTVARPDIKEALRTKVSRERVWIELGKMLKDPHAIHAVRLVHGLGLHPLLLCIPPPSWPLSQPLPSPQHLEHAGLSASETLARALPRASSTTARATPGLDDQGQPFTNISARWLEEAGLHDSEICKRMHLAAALVPLRDITTAEKKKEVWLGDKMLRDVLGVANADRIYICKMHQAATLLRDPVLQRFQDPSERVALGLLLRNNNVHDMNTGPTWQQSLLFGLVVDLQEAGSQDQVAAMVETYNALFNKVHQLKLSQNAFDKPRIDGNDVSNVLGYKPGKATGDLLHKVIIWQLDRPEASKEECLTWFRDQYEQGHFADALTPSAEAAPSKKKSKKT